MEKNKKTMERNGKLEYTRAKFMVKIIRDIIY